MKALDWVRAGWRFARRFENVKPFYLLYAAAFLAAGLLVLLFASSVLGFLVQGISRGPSALAELLRGSLWLVVAALAVLLAFVVLHALVEVACYYRFARKKKSFSLAANALPGAVLIVLLVGAVRGLASNSTAGMGALGQATGTALSLFISIAFFLSVPAYAFRRRGVFNALKDSWRLFSENALETVLFVALSIIVELGIILVGVLAAAAIVVVSIAFPVVLVLGIPLALVVLAYVLGFASALGAGALAAAYLTLSRP